MPLSGLSAVQRTEFARTYVDSAEQWLRRLIHHQMSQAYGLDYLSDRFVSLKISRPIAIEVSKNPAAFNRCIDAASFDQAIDIVCHEQRWKDFFQSPLFEAYPHGREEARTFLLRIKDVRNAVSHGRPVSVRQLEKAICYSNDLIDSAKSFFRQIGMARVYDVPTIVRYVDSLGNESHLTDVPTTLNNRIIDWRRLGNGDLYPGEFLTAEIEIDPSYSASGYDVSWSVFGQPRTMAGPKAQFEVLVQHVSEQMELRFQVRSDREWHRQGDLDDSLIVLFRVLPPI